MIATALVQRQIPPLLEAAAFAIRFLLPVTASNLSWLGSQRIVALRSYCPTTGRSAWSRTLIRLHQRRYVCIPSNISSRSFVLDVHVGLCAVRASAHHSTWKGQLTPPAFILSYVQLARFHAECAYAKVNNTF